MQEDQGSGRSGQNLFRFGALQEEEASPQRNQSGDAVAVGMFTYRQATQGQEASTNFAALHTEANTTERIIEKLGKVGMFVSLCVLQGKIMQSDIIILELMHNFLPGKLVDELVLTQWRLAPVNHLSVHRNPNGTAGVIYSSSSQPAQLSSRSTPSSPYMVERSKIMRQAYSFKSIFTTHLFTGLLLCHHNAAVSSNIAFNGPQLG